ncbi:hypothetical protein ULF88_19320 [Halopseudomonas pachastrellae]|nr:hypothetical protein [Halopseudomonas pachastrellae]
MNDPDYPDGMNQKNSYARLIRVRHLLSIPGGCQLPRTGQAPPNSVRPYEDRFKVI